MTTETMDRKPDIQAEWVYLQYAEMSQFTEVYGFACSQGQVKLERTR